MVKKKKESLIMKEISTIPSPEDIEKRIRLEASEEIEEIVTTVTEQELPDSLRKFAGDYTLSRTQYLTELQPQLMINAQMLLGMMRDYMGLLQKGYEKIKEFNRSGYINEDNIQEYFETQNKVIVSHNKLVDTLQKLEQVTRNIYENFMEKEKEHRKSLEGYIEDLTKIIFLILSTNPSEEDKDRFREKVNFILENMLEVY